MLSALGFGVSEAPVESRKQTDVVELKNSVKKKLQRYQPPGTQLQERRFRVFCALKGERRQFLMTLKVNPPVLVINDDSGDLEFLKVYPALCRAVTISGESSTLWTQTGKIVFEFDNSMDTQSFSDSLSALYGVLTVRVDALDADGKFKNNNRRKVNPASRIRVESSDDDNGDGIHSDADDLNDNDSDSDGFGEGNEMKRHATGCRIHSGIPGVKCDCEMSRPSLEDEQENEALKGSAQDKLNSMYPISIRGLAAAGEKLTMKDLGSNSKGASPTSYEWFLSENFGSGKPEFNRDNPVCTLNVFIPQQNACGRWILLVVRRKVVKGQEVVGVAVSTAQVGPIAPDAKTCRGVMKLLSNFNGMTQNVSANMLTLDFSDLFSCAGSAVARDIQGKVQSLLQEEDEMDDEDKEDDSEIALKSLVPIDIRVTRQGLVFAARKPPAAFSMFWHEFKAERRGTAGLVGEGLSRGPGDTSLTLETIVPHSKLSIRPNLIMASMDERDTLYHYIVYQKLACGEGPSSETWMVDLNDNNFSNMQRLYSGLWRDRTQWGLHIGPPPPQIKKILRELPRRQADLAHRKTEEVKKRIAEEEAKRRLELAAANRAKKRKDDEDDDLDEYDE